MTNKAITPCKISGTNGQERLEHDTLIVRDAFKKYFDRKFEYKIDDSGKYAVLFVRKSAPSDALNRRGLAEHFQQPPKSIGELTKERARKCADPLPIFPDHGRVKFVTAKADAWLLRKGDNTKLKDALEAFPKTAASKCSHEPKHLKGLCLESFNKSLPKDVQVEQDENERVWTAARKNGKVKTRIFVNYSVERTTTEDGHYYKSRYTAGPKLRKLTRCQQVAFHAYSTAETLDHVFGRAFDIVISIDQAGGTHITASIGDREQNWMTVDDVAARLSELFNRPISHSTVEELTKTQTQKRHQGKGNTLPFFKGHSKMLLFYRPLFELWYSQRYGVESTARELGGDRGSHDWFDNAPTKGH